MPPLTGVWASQEAQVSSSQGGPGLLTGVWASQEALTGPPTHDACLHFK